MAIENTDAVVELVGHEQPVVGVDRDVGRREGLSSLSRQTKLLMKTT